MKKLSYLLTAACAVVALTSCEAEKDPVYHAPTDGSFYLYAPAMQDQLIDLEDGGESGTITLTANGQPDYGYSAVANYSAKMSLTEDFASSYDLTPVDPHQSVMRLKQFDIAQGICTLMGIDSEETYLEKFPEGATPVAVYFSASCELNGVAGSLINSKNVVKYNYLKPYFAIASPGKVYLVGNPNGWNINESPYVLKESDDAIGSKIYSGIFNLEAGDEIYFRFYTELGNWGEDGELPSIGGKAVDGDNTPVEWVDGSYTSGAVPGKGSWELIGWEGGEITMVLDLSQDNNWTFTMYSGAVEVFTPSYIYLMGNILGWEAPSTENEALYNPYRLQNSADAPSVYTASYNLEAGDWYIRFAKELNADGWDNATQFGPNEDDGNNLTVSFTNGQFTGPYVMGKGCWEVVLDAAATLDVAVDLDNETVTFTLP